MCVEFRRSKDVLRERGGNYGSLKYKLKGTQVECKECKNVTKDFDVHHIDFDPTNDDITNLQVLCRECHKVIHGKKYYFCYYCMTPTNKRQKYCSFCKVSKNKIGRYCSQCGDKYMTNKGRPKETCSRSCHVAKTNTETKSMIDKVEAFKLLRDGMMKSEVAKHFGVSPSAITKLIKKYNYML